MVFKHPESNNKVHSYVQVDQLAKPEDILDAARYEKERKMPNTEDKELLIPLGQRTVKCTLSWPDLRGHIHKRQRANKWQFEAPDFTSIDFEKIAEDLSGEHPIIFVDYGKTEKYVVVSTRLTNKSLELEYSMPPCSAVELKKEFSCLTVESQFSDWISWAKRVKSASWPATDRKSNTVVVSTPQI